MNSKGHFYTSIIKSAIRIVGAIISMLLCAEQTSALIVLSLSLAIAEVLGILEEVLDRRK